jgi:pSer/pThr/pTyr-binding forkhead associated (FHA) protein
LLVKALDAGSRVARGAVAGPDGVLRIPLAARRVTLGRSDVCDVVVHSSRVAARESVFEATAEGWLARSLGHTRGMVINGQRVFSAVLRPGDVVLLPGVALEFVGDEPAEAARP